MVKSVKTLLVYLVIHSMAESKQISIEVSEPWFTFIKKGLKTIEGKKANSKWTAIKVGDKIKITNKDDECLIQVSKIVIYGSIQEYLEKEGLEKTLPGVKLISDGVGVYEDIWKSLEDKLEIERYGVMAIHLCK